MFIAANVACCPKSAHFSLFLASESWLRGPETSTEVFATQWWYGINERNVVTNRSSNRLRIRMSRVQGWPDYIQNSTACTFLMIYQQKRYQWIWETSMIHSSLLHHEILIWACYQESLSALHGGLVQPKIGSKYWAIRSSARSFARTAHSFACSALLASLARSAALSRSLARSLTRSQARGTV